VLGLRMSIAQVPTLHYFGNDAQRQRFIAAWRKAGVPE
jgi:hypothetical protein